MIGSICTINDETASEFSRNFLPRILPVSAGRGEPIGIALFHSRVKFLRCLTGPERLIGLSYRLIGSPYISINVSTKEVA